MNSTSSKYLDIKAIRFIELIKKEGAE